MLYPRREKREPKIQVNSDHEHYQFVVDQLIGQHKRASIVNKLVKKGMDHNDAVFFVKAVFSKLVRTRRYERLTVGTVVLAFAGGLGAALASSVFWAMTIAASGTPSAIMAVAVGVATGLAILGLSFKQQGALLQLAALIFTSLGLLVGKYAHHFFVLSGHKPVEIPLLLSTEAFAAFKSQFTATFSLLDLIWIPLALGAAVWLSRGWGIRLRAGDHVVGRTDFLIGNGGASRKVETSASDLAEGWAPQEPPQRDW